MKSLLVLIFCLSGFAAQAQQIFIAGGMRSDTADSESSGNSTEGGVGFQAGGILHYDIGGFKIRTGGLYVTKNFDVKSGSTILTEARLSYIEVPVGALFSVNSYADAFAGAVVGFNLAKQCGSGDCSGVNTLPIGIQLGGDFEITSRFGIELYYEMGFTKIADDVKSPRALVAQLLFTF
jgi:hypothetical protein